MKDRYYLKIAQAIGAPPTVTVKVGDLVKRGQVIAEAVPEKLSVPLHASVTGEVVDINDTFVVIEQTEETTDFEPIQEGKDEIETVKNAGVIGMGGAGFPSYVKLGTDLHGKDGYVLCNAAECEIGLEHNMAQIMEEAEALIGGIRIAMDTTGATHGYIAIKLKHKDEIKHLVGLLKEKNITDIQVKPLRNVYPSGEERAIVRDTINITLGPTSLPAEANAVVFNVETLCSIYDAVHDLKPSIDKYISVNGRLKNLKPNEIAIRKYPMGRRVGDIIEEFGGIEEPAAEILIGGTWTGRAGNEDVAINKTIGGIQIPEKFDQVEGKLAAIRCACGPSRPRLDDVAAKMGSEISEFGVCKNAQPGKSYDQYKCKNPGHCPGQVEHILKFKKAGITDVLVGHCSDCTNSVSVAAEKAGIKVHHVTDPMRDTQGKERIRFFDESVL